MMGLGYPTQEITARYDVIASYIRSYKALDDRRRATRSAILRDPYVLASILGYDKSPHTWDPIHHALLAKQLEYHGTPGAQVLWLCPRGTYKTALEEIDITWSILRDPNIRIGLGSWKFDVANRILRKVRGNLENEVVRWLFPDVVPDPAEAEKWTESELVVTRSSAAKDATLTAFSVESMPTSLHFDRTYLDDVVERRNAFTEDGILKTKQILADVRSIRATPASQIYVRGTLWDPEDWHHSLMSRPDWTVERHPAQLEDYDDPKSCPVECEAGLVYPSVKPLDVLEADLRDMGTWHYGGQIRLKIDSAEGSAWNREQVQNYYHLDDLPLGARLYCFVDLATEALEDPDDTVFLVVAAGQGDLYPIYIVDGWAGTCSPDEAAKRLFDLYERWEAPATIEEIGAFQWFERTLQLEAHKRQYMVPHDQIRHREGGGDVKERIRNCDSWFRDLRIKTRNPADIEDEALREFFQRYERQALRWPRVSHDDILDCLADACIRALPTKPQDTVPDASLQRKLVPPPKKRTVILR